MLPHLFVSAAGVRAAQNPFDASVAMCAKVDRTFSAQAKHVDVDKGLKVAAHGARREGRRASKYSTKR
jgi:hypothetical protein